MGSLGIAAIILGIAFGAALLGMALGRTLPAHHLSGDARDAVKLSTGLVATLSALVLGLLVASSKTAFDAQSGALRESAADVVLVNRALAQYGPETQAARENIRRTVEFWLGRVWPEDGAEVLDLATAKASPANVEALEERVRALSPSDERQRELRSRALGLCEDLAHTRWLLFGQIGDRPVPLPFLLVLAAWLVILFFSFGLLAPPNPTVKAALLVCALSAAAAVFLILELGRPFEGVMKIPSTPLRDALSAISR